MIKHQEKTRSMSPQHQLLETNLIFGAMTVKDMKFNLRVSLGATLTNLLSMNMGK